MAKDIFRKAIPVTKAAPHKQPVAVTEIEGDKWEISRNRWKEATPRLGLTWGLKLDGIDFLSKVQKYMPFGSNTKILEIGPGYGRLMETVLSENLPFERYLGVDIAEKNVSYLTETFSNSQISFLAGDAETVNLTEKYNTFLCTVTIHHFYPDFSKLIANVSKYLDDGSFLFFDLHEGLKTYFEKDGVFVRSYTRDQISEILNSLKIEVIAFDQVAHDAEHKRLFVAARKKS